MVEKKDEDPALPNPNEIEFDNLYLDMNGIIHPCCHPEDKPAPATEEDMMHAVFEMLDRLFAVIRPRKLLYMAIDGVAPRAKMNQQRARRFRSAQESQEKKDAVAKLREEIASQGQKLPPEKAPSWDHNVITPGTPFMDKLSQYLRYYIHNKLNTNPAWKGVTIMLSDATVPGEGEHKLVKYIRMLRAQKRYDPNTTHMIAGEDADLIFLAMAMHEARFFILREQKFMGKNQCWICGSTEHRTDDCTTAPPEKSFQFLDVAILRQCLQFEFKDLAVEPCPIPFGYDFDCILDDFIFMCFWVGNDFLPHLPSLDIREGGLDLLMELYTHFLPKLETYLTSNGHVNLKAVKTFLLAFGSMEDEILSKKAQREKSHGTPQSEKQCRGFSQGNCRYGDTCGFKHGDHCPKLSKTKNAEMDLRTKLLEFKNKKGGANEMPMPGLSSFERKLVHSLADELGLFHESKGVGVDRCIHVGKDVSCNSGMVVTTEVNGQDVEQTDSKAAAQQFLMKLKQRMEQEDEALEKKLDDGLRLGEGNWKEKYYTLKFSQYEQPTDGRSIAQLAAEAYIEGLCWVFRYYFDGCASWQWYYPYHYAPFASDLGKYCPASYKFQLGTPFPPMGQLMSVLPAASGHCLPDPCRWYMNDPESPIIDLYPTDFKLDSNGIPARRKWQWVILLPFSDQERVLEVLQKIEPEFTEDEKRRNKLGQELMFFHSTHPVALAVRQELTEKNKGHTDSEEEVSVVLPNGSSGLDGVVSMPLHRWRISPGPTGVAPIPNSPLLAAGAGGGYGERIDQLDDRLAPIASSEVFVLVYTQNPDIPHFCKLLPGAVAHPSSEVVSLQHLETQAKDHKPKAKLAQFSSARRFIQNSLGIKLPEEGVQKRGSESDSQSAFFKVQRVGQVGGTVAQQMHAMLPQGFGGAVPVVFHPGVQNHQLHSSHRSPQVSPQPAYNQQYNSQNYTPRPHNSSSPQNNYNSRNQSPSNSYYNQQGAGGNQGSSYNQPKYNSPGGYKQQYSPQQPQQQYQYGTPGKRGEYHSQHHGHHHHQGGRGEGHQGNHGSGGYQSQSPSYTGRGGHQSSGHHGSRRSGHSSSYDGLD